MGAVMGSKNLKAVAVRGTMPVEIHDPDGALSYLKELTDWIQSSKYAEIMGRLGDDVHLRRHQFDRAGANP